MNNGSAGGILQTIYLLLIGSTNRAESTDTAEARKNIQAILSRTPLCCSLPEEKPKQA
jgi:hypothetical protein